MHRDPITIDRLFDRSTRLPYPLRARTSPARRWAMLVLFIVLSTVIGVYWYLTDARRVRVMAEQYLTELTGTRITVGKATLSIFEGLRLDDVRVYIDPPETVDPKSIRALPIFSASRFQISYDLQKMLRGRLEATRIVATNPRVLLAEDLDAGLWNYQPLSKPAPSPQVQTSDAPPEPLQLPELVLRDARIDYVEVRDKNKASVGSMSLEGQLIASSNGERYEFDLQSRGVTQGLGPSVSGNIHIATGVTTAKLKNFTFGRDIKTMLPALARNWMEQHGLAGRVDVPTLVYRPARDGQPSSFKVETKLDAVSLFISPTEWMTRDETASLGTLRGSLMSMDRVHRQWTLLPAGDRTPFVALAELLDAEPIRLQKVSGLFLFTEKGIEIRDAEARIEDNTFVLNGTIAGYSPDAPLSVRLASRPNENLVLPAAPRWVNAMPAVRQLYLELKPAGEAKVNVWVHRDQPGEQVDAEGTIDIVDGQFQYEKFPYPVQHARGRIAFGPDPKTGEKRLELINLRGNGAAGGPNARHTFVTSGRIAPLGGDPGLDIRIVGERVIHEQALFNALPPPVQEILSQLESPATHPNHRLNFEGGFVCQIDRAPGFDTDVYISTDIRIDDGSGTPAAFAYPLKNVKGIIRVRDDHVDLVDVAANMDGAKLAIGGRVSWVPYHHREGEDENAPRAPKMLHSDIKLRATDVPIDQKLIDALPPEDRPMLLKLGVGGKVDIDGLLTQRPKRILRPPTTRESRVVSGLVADSESPMRWDLGLKIKQGTLKPTGTAWSAENIAADVHVTPERLVFKEITATRAITTTRPTTQPAHTAITASGTVELQGARQITAAVAANNLMLDKPFYDLLPRATQQAWDEVRPAGTVDLAFSLADGDRPFTMSLRPRQMAAQPVKFPLALTDLTGEVRVKGDLVTFDNLQARHGEASLYLAGTQRLDVRDWDVKLAARGLGVTEELLAAVPTGARSFLESIKLRGKVSVDFDKLRVRDNPPTTQPATSPPSIDLASSIWLDNASFDAGVPVEKANGRITLAAAVEQGRLTNLDGKLESTTMQMAGREVKNFRAVLGRKKDEAGLSLSDMQADVAGGTMAGKLDYLVEETGSRYVLNLSLRNADIAELTREDDKKIQGQLSASLMLEGGRGNNTPRRGRGDVTVAGKEIVKLPLLLGLFQITNLALPITGPLSSATARYNIDGPLLTFERVELRGANVLMSGDGKIDFDKRTVRMKFSADNPGGKIPFIGDLLQSANRELLQITVRGTVQDPKVSAKSFGTIGTTVDEVLKGDGQ